MLPLVKLASLLVRQVSKPLSNSIKLKVKSSPNFKKVCVSFAQMYHRFDRRLKTRSMGIKTTKVEPLDDEKAIELGADMLGEFVIVGMAGTILYIDYARNKRNEADKQSQIDAVFRELRSSISTLERKVDSFAKENADLKKGFSSRLGLPKFELFGHASDESALK